MLSGRRQKSAGTYGRWIRYLVQWSEEQHGTCDVEHKQHFSFANVVSNLSTRLNAGVV